jgi:hypothetical protein
MGGSYGTYGDEEKCMENLGGDTEKKTFIKLTRI